MPETIEARNPRAEAAMVAKASNVLVLEPSPPAITVEPFLADDPAALDGASPADVVAPTTAADRSWADLASADATIATFAREHWLANHKPLPPVPSGYGPSRDDFHRVAYSLVARARRLANGKFGLRYTFGGFGTPFFRADEQVRVEGAGLIHQIGDSARRIDLTTLAAAADFLGVDATEDLAEEDTVSLGALDRPLEVSATVGAFLGDWFGFATSVLEELRLMGTPDDDVSRVQIWPGHFDAATELGSSDAGLRATYGASPGDGSHDGPYLYVAAWGDIDRANPFWNDDSFNGAGYPYEALRAASDQRAAALAFFAEAYDMIHS